ncbi:unnamed protein product, partial [Protopolystoma xenopodis]
MRNEANCYPFPINCVSSSCLPVLSQLPTDAEDASSADLTLGREVKCPLNGFAHFPSFNPPPPRLGEKMAPLVGRKGRETSDAGLADLVRLQAVQMSSHLRLVNDTVLEFLACLPLVQTASPSPSASLSLSPSFSSALFAPGPPPLPPHSTAPSPPPPPPPPPPPAPLALPSAGVLVAHAKFLLRCTSHLVQLAADLCAGLPDPQEDWPPRLESHTTATAYTGAWDRVPAAGQLRVDVEWAGNMTCEALKSLIAQAKIVAAGLASQPAGSAGFHTALLPASPA